MISITDASVAVGCREICNLALHRHFHLSCLDQDLFVRVPGERATYELPKLLIRKTTLLGHEAYYWIADRFVSGSVRSFGPYTCFLPPVV
jgi:hypothetical protein